MGYYLPYRMASIFTVTLKIFIHIEELVDSNLRIKIRHLMSKKKPRPTGRPGTKGGGK
jgi:hypothetical protein